MAVPMVQIGSWRVAIKWAKYNEMLFIYLYIFAFFENNILSVKSLKTSFADVRHFKPVWQNTIRNYSIDFTEIPQNYKDHKVVIVDGPIRAS